MSEPTTQDLLNQIGQPDPTDEQLRDELGRFTNAEGEAEPVQEEQEPEVDPQDDLRQQVADMKELIANLSQQLQQPKAPKREVKKPTPEDDFRLSQDLAINPTKALREWFESESGMTIEDFRDRQQQAHEAVQFTRATDAAAKFMQANPGYVSNQNNNVRMERYVTNMGLDRTDAKSWKSAFDELSSSGLLETTAAAAAKPQVATKKAVPGLKTRGGSSAPSSPANSIADEERKMREMPVDQMLAYMASKVNKR